MRKPEICGLCNKHLIFLLTFLFIILVDVIAQDDVPVEENKKDSLQFVPVDGLENWSLQIDTSQYPAGIYNIIVEGEDSAGNRAISDPVNVYIDPESDKPLVSFSNPTPGMRVSGTLNIIGTCLDDDGVSRVDIKVNDGSYSRAEGGKFWSYVLDTSALEDGPCTITARGTDINGLEGNERSLVFILDRQVPENEILFPESGTLVHGKVKLEGQSRDNNGIEKIEYKLEGEELFQEISFKNSKNSPLGEYTISLDTRELQDGPQIVWVRGTDKTGSIGQSSFLMFVDNNPPELDILYPREEDGIDGRFTVVGTALDDIGLARLTAEVRGEEPRDITLIKGDPYWSEGFDFSGEKKGEIKFVLTDLTGNRVEESLNFDLDLERDKPVVDLVFPVNGESYDDPVLSGFIRDDDGAEKILYSLDGEEPLASEGAFSFVIPLGDLTPGEHRVDIRGVDLHGVEGDSHRVEFFVWDKGPSLGADVLIPKEEGPELPFEQALTWAAETYKSFTGHVEFPNGAGTVAYSLDGGEEKKVSLKRGEDGLTSYYAIPLKDLLPGYHRITVRAVDKAMKEAVDEYYFSVEGGAIGRKIHYADYRFAESGRPKETDLVLGEKDRITFFFEGDAPAKAELSRDVPFLNLKISGDRLILESKGSGLAEELNIKVTTKSGREQNLGPYNIVADEKSPQINLAMEEDLILGGDELALSGKISENVAIQELVYSLNGGKESPLDWEEGAFDSPLSLGSLPDGNHSLVFRVKDRAGHENSVSYLFRKRTSPSRILQIAPLADMSANGSVSFVGRLEHPEIVAAVEFSQNGEDFTRLESTGFVKGEILLNDPEAVVEKEGELEEESVDSPDGGLAEGEVVDGNETSVEEVDVAAEPSLPQRPVFKITDKAGNVTYQEPDILIDSEGDKPFVLIQLPKEGTLIESDFSVSGMAFDDDQVSSLEYRVDGGDLREITGVNRFEIPLLLKDLTDNGHTFEIRAIDKNGLQGDWALLNFHVSRGVPRAEVELPLIGETVKGVIEIQGQSRDANGIDRVLISFDNGNTFQRMKLSDLEKPENSSEMESETMAKPGSGQAGEESTEESRDSQETWEENVRQGEVPEEAEPVLDQPRKWRYSFNTGLLEDGNHSLLIKSFDNYGVTSLYTSLLTIDNAAPSLEITVPAEGLEIESDTLIKGYVQDNQGLARVILDVQHQDFPDQKVVRELSLDRQIREVLNLSSFSPGWVNMRIVAYDGTGNMSVVSRNINRVNQREEKGITLISPFDGGILNGDVSVQGLVRGFEDARSVQIFLDGSLRSTVDIKESDYFSDLWDGETLTEGAHSLVAVVNDGKGGQMESAVYGFEYNERGPWIAIDEFSAGDYVTNRPWLVGRAGFDYVEPELEKKELDRYRKERAVSRVEVSLDNGESFQEAKGGEEWKFRLETQEMKPGRLSVLVRAHFNDGCLATASTQLVVDDTPPDVELLTPEEGMRFNDSSYFTGIASDENTLQAVRAALREGSKNQYQVPAFIQGLFLDFHFLGSTYFEAGAGLTFFDDNVKLMGLAGVSPPGRFTGTVMGIKLLANVANLPWDYFFGYDFKNFSTSFAVGTTFHYFTMDGDAFLGDGVALGAMLGQVELVKINLPQLSMFSSYSLYAEVQLWVISSDVDAGIEPRVAFGLRTNVF